MTSRHSFGLVEGDGVVVAVELGGEWTHEDVSDDDVLEVIGQVGAHDAHDALGVLADRLSEDVVIGGQHVVLCVECESDVGQGVDSRAVLVDGDSIEQRLEEGVGAHDQGGARVDRGLVAGDIDVAVRACHLGEVQVPVGLLDNVVLCDLIEASLLVNAWNDHVGLFGFVLHVEAEGFLGEAARLDEGGQLVDADLVIAEADDTVHLADEEGGSLDLLDLTEAHLGGNITVDLALVFADKALDGAGAVGDVKVLAISSVSVRLARVVLGVGEASNGVALLGVDPEVGAASVGHDGETLVVRAEGNVDEVLRVHVVLHTDVLTSFAHGSCAADQRFLLVQVVVDGQRVVVQGDSGGLDGAKKSGKESSGVHRNVMFG